MIGLVNDFKDKIDQQAKQIYENTIIRKLPTFLKKVAQDYPNSRGIIMDRL